MLPPKTDPRWKKIAMDPTAVAMTALPSRMLMMRIKQINPGNDPKKLEEAIGIAYEFFQKNQNIVAQDIKLLFG